MLKYFITILIVAIASGIGLCADISPIDTASDVVGVGMEVHPPPDAPMVEFDGSGVIDYIAQGDIVINDIARRFSVDAKFLVGKEGKKTVRASFNEGAIVGFMLNERREIELLWKVSGN